jgi:NRAMP (natural resistance-associated macrophage protein)-like metal ion transporter
MDSQEQQAARPPHRASTRSERLRATLRALGPGLVSGAADDDPSGIATYSQAGARFGHGLLWTVLLTTPFMIAIQLAAARVGRVTGVGLAGNLRAHYPFPLVATLIVLLVVANTINIAADVAAMGAALRLVIGGGEHGHALLFGALISFLQVWLPYYRLAIIFNWLCLALLAYVAVLFYVHVDWGSALLALLLPGIGWTFEALMMVVAVLGTTISPYLFFWQAGQEVEEMRRKKSLPLLAAPERAAGALLRIRVDTISGMVLSNVIALAIMLATAATLHMAGIRDIETTAQAAEALRPLAGDRAFVLFAAGVIGTGLLAVPVLAGSAAYAVAEVFGWKSGLDKRYTEARPFYGILTGATLIGTALDFTPIDPIKALYYSAVINGVIAVPIMAMLVLLASNARALGPFAIRGALRTLGWIGTVLMTAAVLLMLVAAARS